MEVTLDFAFWGNDIRAEMYNEAIAVFNEEYPNITVNPTFLAWDEYWESVRPRPRVRISRTSSRWT